MRLPTFAARADNLVADPDFDGFADDVLPSAPGRPPSYTHRLVALEDRVTTTAPIPFVLAATTFGEDAYCRSSMIGLGFTSADLLP
jgi:hypothetical protein